jgi:DNA-binding SARP family transcriptional activator/TolB-like protein
LQTSKSDTSPSVRGGEAIEIRLLGPMQIRMDGIEIARLPRKTRALLAYLIVRRGVAIPRESIAGLLWGGRSEDQARASLRQSLSLIRKAFGPAADTVLTATRESVTFVDRNVRLDLDELMRLGERGDIEGLSLAVEFVRGEFLEGMSLGEPPFEQWLLTERENVRRQMAASLDRLAQLLEKAGRLNEAIAYTQKYLSQNPTDEAKHRTVMRLYIAQRRHDQAIAQFEQCQRQLKADLGVEPDAETGALLRRARSERGRRAIPDDRRRPEETGAPDGAASLIMFGTIAGDEILVPASGGSGEREDTQREQICDKIRRFGGTVVAPERDGFSALFFDPAEALLCAMEIRKAGASGVPNIGPAPRIGLHAAARGAAGETVNPQEKAVARRLSQTAEPGGIQASEAFFATARRTSPCFFEDLGDIDRRPDGSFGRVYRVSRNMARHPFQASHVIADPSPPIRENSVAVRPISVLGPDSEDQAFLAEGLTEDLVLELSRLGHLFVSSRTTIAAMERQDPVEIGRKLGVQFVLSGSLRKSAARVRLNLSLAETGEGRVVWSDRLTRTFDELLNFVDEIGVRVAGSVGSRIEQEQIATSRLKRPENMTAYEYYLRGIWHHRMGGITQEHTRKAVEWLKRSIAADPTFARPRAALACAWSDLPDYDDGIGMGHVDEALKLDPTDPEAHRIKGIACVIQRDFDAGRYHHERAMAMAPNDAYIVGRSAAFYSFVGEPQKALELLDRAETLDPFLPVYVVEERLIAEYGLGRFDSVLTQAQRLPFQSRRSSYYSTAALHALGREDEGVQLMRETLEADVGLSVDYVLSQEHYQDRAFLDRLLARLHAAGLPRAS